MRLLLALAATSLCLCPFAASAGINEASFLASLPGKWTGSGTVGTAATPMPCTLTLWGKDKINFSGQCNAGQYGQQTYKGVLTYDEKAKRYVARAGGTTVAGNKSGGGVVFKFPLKTMAGPGHTVMSVSANKITIEFSVTQDSGETLNLRVAFAKP